MSLQVPTELPITPGFGAGTIIMFVWMENSKGIHDNIQQPNCSSKEDQRLFPKALIQITNQDSLQGYRETERLN